MSLLDRFRPLPAHLTLSAGPKGKFPSIVHVVVEIPARSRIKYEMDPETGAMCVDRVLFSPFHYPTEYGFIPSTIAPDGDPCDAMVLIHEPTYPGVVIPARPVGLLKMSDEKGSDDKVLCVAEGDPAYTHIRELADLPPHLMKEIEHFFSSYKQLEGKPVTSEGWTGPDEALAFVMACAGVRKP